MSLSEDLNKSFYEDLARKNSALDITASYLILQVICSTCCRYYPADNRYLPIILKSIMGKITKWPTNKMYYLYIEFYSVSFFYNIHYAGLNSYSTLQSKFSFSCKLWRKMRILQLNVKLVCRVIQYINASTLTKEMLPQIYIYTWRAIIPVNCK